MKYYDVSNWSSKSFSTNTKGSRDKGILFDPLTGDEYFIKFPMIRRNRDYSMETWSEILAYEIGTLLGFNVLRYDFGMQNERAGCISKNMVSEYNESLIEGDSILMAYDPTYDPKEKSSYNRYTFSFVLEALKAANLDQYSKDFVKILIFDSIIGNSDRHQSNWGFIQKVNIKISDSKIKFFKKKSSISVHVIKREMAPIYDSGCCFGREFGEEQIKDKMDDINKFHSFIHKGRAELRIDSEPDMKKSHFELLKGICSLNDNWKEFIVNEINRVVDLYAENKEKIEDIVSNIDLPLPDDVRTRFGLSEQRKIFVIRIIDSRINELKNIVYVSTD